MEIWIATGNKGKLAEIRTLLEGEFPKLKIQALSDLPVYSAPPENGQSFLDNARIKGKSLKSIKNNDWVIAEDSGLEVEGLGNLPGIHSARYAGPKAQDRENVAKLLKMMQIRAITNRNARFTCALVAYSPDGKETIFNGEMTGTICKTPVGQMGFGYDPVFVPTGQTQTLAELGPGFKNRHSHRALAIKNFIELLKQFNNT